MLFRSVAFFCGITLAVASYIKIMLVDGVGSRIAIVVSIAIAAIVIVAKIAGGILPVVAKALHLDPAVMSNPLISTLIDAVSLLIYFAV